MVYTVIASKQADQRSVEAETFELFVAARHEGDHARDPSLA